MKVYWIAPRDVRKNRADAVRVMLDCTGFAKVGAQVTLITPHVHRPEYRVPREEIWRQYGLVERFRIVELPTFYRDERDRPSRWRLLAIRAQKLAAGTIAALVLAAVSVVRREPRYIVAHCAATSLPFVLLGRLLPPLRWRVFFLPGAFLRPRRLERLIARSCVGVLAGNSHIATSVIEAYGVDAARVLHKPRPYSYLDLFEAHGDSETRGLDFGDGRKIVLYVGKVGYPPYADVELILETAKLLQGYRFVVVGGNGESELAYAERARELGVENVTWLGFQPLTALFPLVRSADALLSYYSASDPLASRNRIPEKFALYRCAGKPIVASDFPGVREVLGEDEAFFVPPDWPDELARTIEAVFADPDEAARRGLRALETARRSTIVGFCEEILRFMKSCGPSVHEAADR